jgi:thiamine pyrophosphokinase
MKLNIAIVGNGNNSDKLLPVIRKADYIIGVDRAAYWLIEHQIVPDVAIGDFDSVTKDEYRKIKFFSKKLIEYPQDKDYIDTELALKFAVTKNPQQIIIFGTIGSRFDQTLASVQLLGKYTSHNTSLYIKNETNEIYYLSEKKVFKKSLTLPYLSILPITSQILISINGCKYNLTEKVVRRGQSKGVSNEIISKNAVVTIHKGQALVIRSRD